MNDKQYNNHFSALLTDVLRSFVDVKIQYSHEPKGRRIGKVDLPLISGYINYEIRIFGYLVDEGYLEV